MPCNEEMRRECEKKFEELDTQLGEKGRHLGDAERNIVRLETQVDNLIRSMSSLTRALWGACGTMMATLLGFFVWFVQQH